MDDGKKPIYEHVKELRYRLISSIIIILVLSIISYFFYDLLLNFLVKPLGKELIFLAPQDAFLFKFKVIILTGFLFSFPAILYHSCRFISSAPDKKIKVSLLFISAVILFIISLIFSYFVVLPVGLKFLLSFASDILKPEITADKYFSFIFSLFLGPIIIFQMPLIIFSLNKMGIIRKKTLKENRKIAVLAIFIIAAIVTPPDAITMFLLAIPLIMIYEASIILIKD